MEFTKTVVLEIFTLSLFPDLEVGEDTKKKKLQVNFTQNGLVQLHNLFHAPPTFTTV